MKNDVKRNTYVIYVWEHCLVHRPASRLPSRSSICCKVGICYSEAPWSYNTQTFDKCNYLYRTSLYIKAFKWKQNILFPLCNVGSGENRCRPYYPQIRWYSKMSACLSSIVQSLEHNHIEQFWSFTSSKVKRTRILEKQTSMIRISEASNSLRLSGSEAFIPPFHKCLNKYRSREKLDTVFIMEFMRF